MSLVPLYSEVIVRKENAAALETLLAKIAYPAGKPPSVALVLDVALYAEERLVAQGIEPEARVGCSLWFRDKGPGPRAKKARAVPCVGVERTPEGWALYQAGHSEVRPGERGVFGFGYSLQASALIDPLA